MCYVGPMPLYLVRWPDLTAALVKARSEDELVDVLDEVANSEGCTWSVYRGPLFLEFALPAKASLVESRGPKGDSDVKVADVEGLFESAPLAVSVPDGDTALAMSAAIERKVFPVVFKARHGKSEPTVAALKKAVAAEMQVAVQASWRSEHVGRRDDQDSRLAAMMDAPERVVRRWKEWAAGSTPGPKKR
jgi:predicted RecB family endonuclease